MTNTASTAFGLHFLRIRFQKIKIHGKSKNKEIMKRKSYRTVDISNANPVWMLIAHSPFGMIIGRREENFAIESHFWYIPNTIEQLEKKNKIWKNKKNVNKPENFIDGLPCSFGAVWWKISRSFAPCFHIKVRIQCWCNLLVIWFLLSNKFKPNKIFLKRVEPNLRTTPWQISMTLQTIWMCYRRGSSNRLHSKMEQY